MFESERSSELLLLLLELELLELELELELDLLLVDSDSDSDSDSDVFSRRERWRSGVDFRAYADFSKSCTRACERSRNAILSILESPLRVSFEDGRFAMELNRELLAEFRARECGWSTMDAECSE